MLFAGALLLIDGLAYGAMPEEAAAQAARLRLVALVHHPLGDEGGLAPAERQRLLASETAALAAARAVICTSPATARRLAEFGVAASARTTLAEDIAWADTVAGCDTMAMVVALAAGRRVISVIPPGGRPLTLPFGEIERLYGDGQP